MPKITVYGGASFWEEHDQKAQKAAEEPQDAVQDDDSSIVDTPGGQGPSMPSTAAPKADWVEYAVACGWLRDDAEAVTKQQLINQFKD